MKSIKYYKSTFNIISGNCPMLSNPHNGQVHIKGISLSTTLPLKLIRYFQVHVVILFYLSFNKKGRLSDIL